MGLKISTYLSIQAMLRIHGWLQQPLTYHTMPELTNFENKCLEIEPPRPKSLHQIEYRLA